MNGRQVTFRIYRGDKRNSEVPIRTVTDCDLNLGTAYLILANASGEINRPEPWDWVKANSLAGKHMGLAAYGTLRKDWSAAIYDFYHEYSGYQLESLALRRLGTRLGFHLAGGVLKGQRAADFAAAAQDAFERVVLGIANEIISEERLPLIMTGGCALNVQVNQKLRDQGIEVFVPPCPNDCGLALGFALSEWKPQEAPNITYSGTPLTDLSTWSVPSDILKLPTEILSREIAEQLVVNRRIVGVARDGSEVGPRALGNRSILAHVTTPGLKEKINATIKYREAFRPVAAVVRLVDAPVYFEIAQGHSAQWMSFAPIVREEWRIQLREIMHADTTCRIQTVTKEQNEFLYSILDEIDNLEFIPILLNTSFNSRGHPILTTAADAYRVFSETALDGVVIQNFRKWK